MSESATTSSTKRYDVILIGAGIMSTTLGAILKELQPEWNIALFESLDSAGEEASDPWNNAGTGHAALCELNYTPRGTDGTISTAKAAGINEQFHVSKQLWS
ncbi:MAG: malate:quinone oxidoreductase, partial [Nesterenkonia sp.]